MTHNIYTATRAARTTDQVANLGFGHLGWTLHLSGGDVEIIGGDWLRASNAPKPGDTTRKINTRDTNGQAVEIDLPLNREIEVTPRASEWSTTAGHRDAPGYPESHTWGEFAGLAVELGGYGDITLVDPGTGSRFWFRPGAHLDTRSAGWFWDALIEAIQAAKATGWQDRPTGTNL